MTYDDRVVVMIGPTNWRNETQSAPRPAPGRRELAYFTVRYSTIMKVCPSTHFVCAQLRVRRATTHVNELFMDLHPKVKF